MLGDDHADLAALLGHLEETLGALQTLSDSTATAHAARRTLDDADQTLEQAAREAGFTAADAALAAVLTDEQVAALRATIDDHAGRVSAVTAVLEDPDVVAAAAGDAPDVDALDRRSSPGARRSRGRPPHRSPRDRARGEARRASRTPDRGGRGLAPVRDELDLVTGLASFVEGKSGDNRLQMRLSAYVLGYRLPRSSTPPTRGSPR